MHPSVWARTPGVDDLPAVVRASDTFDFYFAACLLDRNIRAHRQAQAPG